MSQMSRTRLLDTHFSTSTGRPWRSTSRRTCTVRALFGAFAVKFADFVSNAGGLCSGSVKPVRAKRLGAKYARVIPSYREAAALWDVDAAALDIIDDIEGGINSLP